MRKAKITARGVSKISFRGEVILEACKLYSSFIGYQLSHVACVIV